MLICLTIPLLSILKSVDNASAFNQTSTLRILELCNKYNYTPNKLAELSAIAPSTLRALLANNVDNPSSTIIFKICKTLKIELKDFYDSPLFDMEKLEY